MKIKKCTIKTHKKTISNITSKAKNSTAIRVLYKNVGQVPMVKIVNNVFKLKKAVINKKLAIIPYQNVFIICNNKKEMKKLPLNVVFDFTHIAGDFIVIEIDSKKREFKSISYENITWFTSDLINKSFNYKPAINTKSRANISSTDFVQNYANNFSFEDRLINVLTNIELNLVSLVSNTNCKPKNKKWGIILWKIWMKILN